MPKNEKELLEYLKSQRLMSLATYNDKPWICAVYYVVDDDFNLYFLSEPDSKHCKDINSNKYVACSIFDSKQKVTDKKIGIQLQGIANEVSSMEKIRWMLKMWNKINPGIENIINIKNIKKRAINSKIYKIRPIKIKFFNEELYGPEGFRIFNFR